MSSSVPAGPALIGFSMSLTTSIGQPTCGLYSLETGALIASASPDTVSGTATVALTQVVTLTAPTTLELESVDSLVDVKLYTDLSIYALSFATT
jgi:hypothetical protein